MNKEIEAKHWEAQQIRVPIARDGDIVRARAAARGLASELGFRRVDVVILVTVTTEMARNLLEHAGRGEIVLESIAEGDRSGFQVVARDQGPGIADLEEAMERGLGLPGSRRLTDDFQVESAPGRGTMVRVRKWLA